LKLRLAVKGIQCDSIHAASPGNALVLVTAVDAAVSLSFMAVFQSGFAL
jgi:hypothetical protein